MDDEFTKEALRFMTDAKKADKPFFCLAGMQPACTSGRTSRRKVGEDAQLGEWLVARRHAWPA